MDGTGQEGCGKGAEGKYDAKGSWCFAQALNEHHPPSGQPIRRVRKYLVTGPHYSARTNPCDSHDHSVGRFHHNTGQDDNARRSSSTRHRGKPSGRNHSSTSLTIVAACCYSIVCQTFVKIVENPSQHYLNSFQNRSRWTLFVSA